MTLKHYVNAAIERDPVRYGTDDGDLNIINDCFTAFGWEPLSREQLRVIMACQRYRNYYLRDHEAFDMRTKRTAMIPVGQTTMWDYLPPETTAQSKKLVKFYKADPRRLALPADLIKKRVNGVDDDHITATRIMYPLLKNDLQIKPVRVKRQPADIAKIVSGKDEVADEVVKKMGDGVAVRPAHKKRVSVL